jgi:hypothetical protein
MPGRHPSNQIGCASGQRLSGGVAEVVVDDASDCGEIGMHHDIGT